MSSSLCPWVPACFRAWDVTKNSVYFFSPCGFISTHILDSLSLSDPDTCFVSVPLLIKLVVIVGKKSADQLRSMLSRNLSDLLGLISSVSSQQKLGLSTFLSKAAIARQSLQGLFRNLMHVWVTLSFVGRAGSTPAQMEDLV